MMSDNRLEVNITGNPGEGNSYTLIQNYKGGVVNHCPNMNGPQGGGENFRPLLLTDIIKALANPSSRVKQKRRLNTTPFDFTPKVEFNKLVRWAYYIQNLKDKTVVVEKIYREFDRRAMDVSDAVLDWLHEEYDQLKADYEGDALFDEIQNQVYCSVSRDPNMDCEMRMEMLNYNIRIVLVDAFLKCSIFEKPIA